MVLGIEQPAKTYPQLAKESRSYFDMYLPLWYGKGKVRHILV